MDGCINEVELTVYGIFPLEAADIFRLSILENDDMIST